MIARTAMAALVGLAALLNAVPAAAQDLGPDASSFERPVPGGGEGQREGNILSPRAIMGSLFRRGYRDIDIKRLRGTNYIATAQSPRGYRVLVVVDGQTTEITGLRPLGYDRPQPFFDGGGFPPRPWGGPRW